jgi:nucleotide-binding universal stress UspA family protein
MIVVGVDGSPGSQVALRWALAEARLRAVGLRVVMAYQIPQLAVGGPFVGAPGVFSSTTLEEDIERLRSESAADARRVLEEVLARARTDVTDGIEVEADAVDGPPADTLIAAGRDAELLVVGSRGRGGFAGLLLGSVSQQCAQHPPCPVVILPPPEGFEAK